MHDNSSGWWRGRRGEWYVVGQLVLIALVFFGPRTSALLPAWPPVIARIATAIGYLLMIGGATLLLAGALRHGRTLTPLPYPKDDGRLIQTGAYRIVRHPIYAGGLLLAYGWALVVHGWLTLLYVIVLHVFLSIKADREERWLVARYPEYVEYQHHTPKLIPFFTKPGGS